MTKEDAGEARKAIADAISSAVARRLSKCISAWPLSTASGSGRVAAQSRSSGVSTPAGHTQLTRMPQLGHEVGGHRLPLVEASHDERDRVRDCLSRLGLLQPATA